MLYDSEEITKMHEIVGIKSFFRGESKDDSTKIYAIQQGPIGAAQKAFEDNKEMIRYSGQIIKSTATEAYLNY